MLPTLALAAGAGTASDVVTPLDYFESGRRAVESFLDRDTGGRRSVSDGKRLCVRVEIRYGEQAAGYRSVLGSGVRIGNGRYVLTAGHSVLRASEGEIHVTLSRGDSYGARLIGHRYEALGGRTADWALLELIDAPPLATPVRLDRARPGALAFVLGYPDQIGISADGSVIHGSAATSYLEPLVTVGTVRAVAPLTLRPHAGAIPTGGMSGGPVFDARGRLVGIFVALLRDDSSEEDRYTYSVMPVSAIEPLRSLLGPERRLPPVFTSAR